MLSFSTHILFGLRPDSSNTPWSALVIVIPFLSFEGTTHANLLKISITHNKKQTLLLHLLMNPTQDGLFRCCSPMCVGGGGAKRAPPPENLSHISQNDETLPYIVIPYPKKIQKIYESRDTPLEFCWQRHFFTANQQILLYQEYRYRFHFADNFNLF